MAELADRLVALLTASIDHLRSEPRVAAGVVLLAGLLYYLLQRKSRIEREADHRLGQLRRDKSGHYDDLRPPH